MRRPGLIIADEPTTALDVTVQRQITRPLTDIRRDTSTAILFISHDIALVGEFCERGLVMYAGTIVEVLPADRLADGARHPYARAPGRLGAGARRRPLPAIEGAPPNCSCPHRDARSSPAARAAGTTAPSRLHG
ncbi:hypothetical protein [Streptomyces sp. NPDC048650]|uniref:hypothetical protein n=1 Tax=unclassified Streptomyces TaxID=2593676 RepID=UPI00371ABC35